MPESKYKIKKYKIKDVPKVGRQREKLDSKGPENLKDEEFSRPAQF